MEQRRGIDIVAMSFSALCLVAAGVGLFLQPAYRRTFADFGGPLPGLTELMLHPATLVVAGLFPSLLLVESVLKRRSEARLVALCVIALIITFAATVAFLAAMYVPLLRIEDDIH